MRENVLPIVARVLGWLALAAEVVVSVALAIEIAMIANDRDVEDFWSIYVWLGGGITAVVALIAASRAKPRGAGKGPALAALVLMLIFTVVATVDFVNGDQN